MPDKVELPADSTEVATDGATQESEIETVEELKVSILLRAKLLPNYLLLWNSNLKPIMSR